MYATILLSWYRTSLCKVHIAKIQHLYVYLKKYTSASMNLNTNVPIYDKFNKFEGNWVNLYYGDTEYLPH